MSDQDFTVKDNRKLNEAGETDSRKNNPAPEKGEADENYQFPQVTFSTFIFSLATSVLINLGEMPDPHTRQTHSNLPMAKHTIDTLKMLQEKSKGNLDAEEENLLVNMLYELRMKYVAAVKK